jgi:carbonic anhydrase/acetyltransferase-like protein (isoleucine patch superfamily)
MPVDGFITPFGKFRPQIAEGAFVDVSARLIGRVRLDKGTSVWPGAVLRADDEEIVLGQGSAVLDLCLVEAPQGKPVIIEPGALISHQACLHGATVKSGALVGIGAIVLDGAVVGEGALIGAGALVPPGKTVPPGMLMLGQPAKAVRELTPEERDNVAAQLTELEEKARVYMELNQQT